MQKKAQKDCDTQSFIKGMISAIALGVTGGAAAYTVKKNPEHISLGMLASIPYMFYHLHKFLTAEEGKTTELLDGAEDLALKSAHAIRALDESSYIKLFKKRRRNKVAPNDMLNHLASEELERRALLENLRDTTQSPARFASDISQEASRYHDSNHSWSEGVLYGFLAQSLIATGWGFYLGTRALLKHKAATGSYFKA